jgi:hypothetical protein
LQIGGITYPVALPGADKSLVPFVDPVLAKLLPYYRAVLRHYLDAAFASAMAGQATTACSEAVGVDVSEYLENLAPRLPLLAMYPVRTGEARLVTLELYADTTVYRLDYYLPVLNADQAVRVLPLLQAARKLLVGATYAQGDENVAGSLASSGVLAQAGVTEMRVGRSEFTKMGEAAHRVPLLSIEVEVDVQGRPTFDGADLSAINASLDVGAEADGALFPNLVEVKHTP